MLYYYPNKNKLIDYTHCRLVLHKQCLLPPSIGSYFLKRVPSPPHSLFPTPNMKMCNPDINIYVVRLLCIWYKITLTLYKQILCCSRKYPYPSYGRFFDLNSPSPLEIPVKPHTFFLKDLAFGIALAPWNFQWPSMGWVWTFSGIFTLEITVFIRLSALGAY